MATLTRNSLTILKARYLAPTETVDNLWDRVSGGDPRFRKLLSSLRFMPNSPTLYNAGLNNGCTLSACFVFDVSDTMLDDDNGIHPTRGKAIAVAKAGGGVGYYLSNLRPKDSLIKSIHRKACGPVAVLRDYHGVRQLITQGGKRDLAQMGVLDCDHADIHEFIHCKDEDPRSLESFNISVGWHNLMAQEAIDARKLGHDNQWRALWEEQVDSAWRHGCPGMFFPGIVNAANPNPHLGLMKAPNPCGETPNRNDEPCNLGSLALPRYYNPANRDIDWNALEEDAWQATLFLDDVLDRNTFPHPSITAAALLTRKLGLGVMGWADLLAHLHIHYDTQEAVALGSRLMAFLSEVSHGASEYLAKTKGPYAGYSDKTEGPCRRNETTTSIAPTGTITIIAGCDSWSIEPHYGLDVERTTNEGLKLLEKFNAEKYDGWVPKVASDIHWSWHVRMQAAFQHHTDLGVSKTINLPNSATRQDVSNAYQMMFEMECKGGTVFRDGCREEQVLVKKKGSVYSTGLTSPSEVVTPRRRKLPDECPAKRKKFHIGGVEGYIHPGEYEDSTLGEIFITTGLGSTIDGLLDTWAKSFSNALQHGTPLEQLVRMHRNQRFEPSGVTGDPDIPVCTSIPDYVVRYLEKRYLKKGKGFNGQVANSAPIESGDSGVYCPDCQSTARYAGGCLTCTNPDCGWTRCG